MSFWINGWEHAGLKSRKHDLISVNDEKGLKMRPFNAG